MKLLLHGVHISLSESLREVVRDQLLVPLEKRIQNEAAELEVHFHDLNGPKGGQDKQCQVSLRLPDSPPIHITEEGENFFQCIQRVHDRLVPLAHGVSERSRSRERRKRGAGAFP